MIVRDDGSINVTLHLDKGYRYARAQVFHGISESGKRVHRLVRLGSVDESHVFIPNHRYIYADEAFRSRLVFPSEWNLEKAKAMIHPGTCESQGVSSLMGVKTFSLPGYGVLSLL